MPKSKQPKMKNKALSVDYLTRDAIKKLLDLNYTISLNWHGNLDTATNYINLICGKRKFNITRIGSTGRIEVAPRR